MNRKTLFITVAALLAALFAGAVALYQNQQAEAAARAAAKNKESLVRFHSPGLGKADARVHIVEFLDPACETCGAFYPFVKKLMAEHPDDIRLSVRYAPFHQGSDEVVKALEAARKQGKYWESLEALFSAQSRWTENHRARVELAWPVLARAGVDTERGRQEMQSPDIARIISQDVADAKTLDVTKTPGYFVNGRPLVSFGYEQLRDLVNEELQATSAKRQ
ncbi:MAG: oxidoreductase [Ramlibacter sp.]|jgi:protein-disulfide isomerase|nr:oxidoreductase [Ramlibacter sp.]